MKTQPVASSQSEDDVWRPSADYCDKLHGWFPDLPYANSAIDATLEPAVSDSAEDSVNTEKNSD